MILSIAWSCSIVINPFFIYMFLYSIEKQCLLDIKLAPIITYPGYRRKLGQF